MSNTDKYIKEELEKLYQIYMRVQSGDKSALDELFKEKNIDDRTIYRADEKYKERRMANMDNVLDTELVLDDERDRQEKEWLNSSDSKVMFQFPCLNKMLYKKKKNLCLKQKIQAMKMERRKKIAVIRSIMMENMIFRILMS